MDTRTKLLISVGSAAAVNCIPCFEYYCERAKKEGITLEEINGAADIAVQIKRGADTETRRAVCKIVGAADPAGEPCCPDRLVGRCCQ